MDPDQRNKFDAKYLYPLEVDARKDQCKNEVPSYPDGTRYEKTPRTAIVAQTLALNMYDV